MISIERHSTPVDPVTRDAVLDLGAENVITRREGLVRH
jgi:hypothetical protein